jgi:hypothetical protein
MFTGDPEIIENRINEWLDKECITSIQHVTQTQAGNSANIRITVWYSPPPASPESLTAPLGTFY